MRVYVLVVLAVCALFALATQSMAGELLNGNFEEWSSSFSMADNWLGYNVGTGWSFMQDWTNFRGTIAQQLARGSSSGSQIGGIRQVVAANPGDAFTLGDAWLYSKYDSTKVAVTIRAALDGAAWIPANQAGATVNSSPIWATAEQSANSWYEFTSHPAGNTTGNSAMFIFDCRVATGTASSPIDVTWDDITIYHAYVPGVPVVGNPTANSLNIDVNPGENAGNASAQYAISIGGGAYSVGNSWLGADGTVGTAPIWQTDALWGNVLVSGLSASTQYSFQVKSRYSDQFTQNTTLGVGGVGTTSPVPEPGSMASVIAGLFGLVGFGIKRRK